MGRSTAAVYAPSTALSHESVLLPVDERLVRPEANEEMRDGVLYQKAPSNDPHAKAHAHVTSVVSAVVRDEYTTAVDMLTRTSKTSDFAPDVSVVARARTADNQLPMTEIAFEIADSQTRGDARWKAEKLAQRGCRRVFLLDVERSVLCEYDHAQQDWQELASDALIEDPVFATSLTASDLVKQLLRDELLVDTLRAKRSPALAALESSAQRKGKTEGKAEGTLQQAKRALYRVLTLRFNVTHHDAVELCTDVETLEKWHDRAIVFAELERVFDEA